MEFSEVIAFLPAELTPTTMFINQLGSRNNPQSTELLSYCATTIPEQESVLLLLKYTSMCSTVSNQFIPCTSSLLVLSISSYYMLRMYSLSGSEIRRIPNELV